MIYNDSQKKAVMHTTGPMMVLAGPGSGKTAVITGRTCQLVTSGISASRILVVTFTRAAAKEMKERYLKAMGKTSTQSPLERSTGYSTRFCAIRTACPATIF